MPALASKVKSYTPQFSKEAPGLALSSGSEVWYQRHGRPTQVPASALETRVTGSFCSQPVDVTGLFIGTDASGGPNTRDPRLGAVGWSVVLCKRTEGRLVELGTISGLLPPGSTVPQGESLAIIHALTATTGTMDLTCDCKPAIHALRARKLCNKHIPEWGQVWHCRTRVQPHWVRSHCTPEAFEQEFPSQQWRQGAQ